MNHYIVAWDPKGEFWEGSIVPHAVATLIRGRNGAALPVDPTVFAVAGNAGYFRRSWGAGWPLDFATPRHICPLALHLPRTHRLLHWVARIVPTEALRDAGGPPKGEGQISLMSYPVRGGTRHATITPRTGAVRFRDLGDADADGGWTIGGTAFVNVSDEGQHAFALYGAGTDVRVAWAAVTAVKGS